MTSGARTSATTSQPSRRAAGRTLSALALTTLLPALSIAQPPALDVDTLLALLGRHDALRARFHERKFLRQLDGPVDSSGELSFEAPATMVMRTLEPRPETMRLDGRTVTLERGRQRRTFQLDEHPEIAIYVEAIRAALAGDRAALERHYGIEVEGGATDWTLGLVPKEPRLAAQVRAIVLSGRQGHVRQVEVRLADGDYSVMNIEPAAAP